jgi:hypothetical protein
MDSTGHNATVQAHEQYYQHRAIKGFQNNCFHLVRLFFAA